MAWTRRVFLVAVTGIILAARRRPPKTGVYTLTYSNTY